MAQSCCVFSLLQNHQELTSIPGAPRDVSVKGFQARVVVFLRSEVESAGGALEALETRVSRWLPQYTRAALHSLPGRLEAVARKALPHVVIAVLRVLSRGMLTAARFQQFGRRCLLCSHGADDLRHYRTCESLRAYACAQVPPCAAAGAAWFDNLVMLHPSDGVSFDVQRCLVLDAFCHVHHRRRLGLVPSHVPTIQLFEARASMQRKRFPHLLMRPLARPPPAS